MTFQELLTFLKSAESGAQINERRAEIEELIPEIRTMYDFDQKMKTQCDDLWTHSVNTVARLPKDLTEERQDDLLYLAALLHDIGKPQTQAADKKNPEYMSYDGHSQEGVRILKESIIPRLNANGTVLDESDISCLTYYIGQHQDVPGRVKKYVRRHMKIATVGQLLNLMRLQIADSKAQYKCKETELRVEVCDYILKKGEEDITSLFIWTKWLF